jgi:hypothetical protein
MIVMFPLSCGSCTVIKMGFGPDMISLWKLKKLLPRANAGFWSDGANIGL